MGYSKYKPVFYNETSQKVWRTNTTIGDIPIEFDYVGTMTEVEFELLLEVLFEIFSTNDIMLDDFERVFGDIRTFCDIIKRLVNET